MKQEFGNSLNDESELNLNIGNNINNLNEKLNFTLQIRPSEGGATGSDDDVFLLGNLNQTKVSIVIVLL